METESPGIKNDETDWSGSLKEIVKSPKLYTKSGKKMRANTT